MANLVLGPAPGGLMVRLLCDDPWGAQLTLKHNGVATAWPVQPVLEFDDGTTWISILDNADTRATWTQDQEDVDALLATKAHQVRLSVDDVTWWRGVIVRV